MLMLNITAYFTEMMFEKKNLLCPRTRTVHSACATKATILFMEVGIFYIEIFPNKMSVYIRLRCINPSTIRREQYAGSHIHPNRPRHDLKSFNLIL